MVLRVATLACNWAKICKFLTGIVVCKCSCYITYSICFTVCICSNSCVMVHHSHVCRCTAVPSAGRPPSVATSRRMLLANCLHMRCDPRWSKRFSAQRGSMSGHWRTLWRLAWQPCMHPTQCCRYGMSLSCAVLTRGGREHRGCGCECGGGLVSLILYYLHYKCKRIEFHLCTIILTSHDCTL